jgi:hypothetical protein
MPLESTMTPETWLRGLGCGLMQTFALDVLARNNSAPAASALRVEDLSDMTIRSISRVTTVPGLRSAEVGTGANRFAEKLGDLLD